MTLMKRACPWGWSWSACTEKELCYLCVSDKVKALELQVGELKKTICAGICGVDFPGFAVGEHMPRCPLRTPCQRPHTPVSILTLYEDGIRSIQCGNCEIQIALLPSAVEKPKCEHSVGYWYYVKPFSGGESVRHCFECEKPAPEKQKCECVWLDGGAVGEYRDPKVPCPVHDAEKRKQKADGNPWAPNQDYPTKSIERPNHVCEKCGAVQPPMSVQTFGVCQKCGAGFSYVMP